MRELARRDVEELVPRPLFGVFGLATPMLRPAALAASGQVNDVWESITVAYGDWSAPTGPYVAVTTAAPASPVVGDQVERELRRAVEAEGNRVADQAGVDQEEPAEPPLYTGEELPAGPAVVCRHGTVWAARLLAGAEAVTVTITGRGVEPDSVRLETLGDLRPYYEARNEILGQLAERYRNQPPPALQQAEGVAAFRALADHTLDFHQRLLESVRGERPLRRRAGDSALQGALWRRAASEQQRIAGIDKRAADEVVTLVINHLGHLLEEAPWFSDPRLRDLAIDETLRHAMLGDDVPSRPAQDAWAQYWALRNEHLRRAPEPGDVLAAVTAGEHIDTDWLGAWADWAARALSPLVYCSPRSSRPKLTMPAPDGVPDRGTSTSLRGPLPECSGSGDTDCTLDAPQIASASLAGPKTWSLVGIAPAGTG
jgi:hypothetical protein